MTTMPPPPPPPPTENNDFSKMVAMGNFSLLRSLPKGQRLYVDTSTGTLAYDERYLMAVRRYSEGSSRNDVLSPIRQTFKVLRNEPAISITERLECIDTVRERLVELYKDDSSFLRDLADILSEAADDTIIIGGAPPPPPPPPVASSILRQRRGTTAPTHDFSTTTSNNVTDNPSDVFIAMDESDADEDDEEVDDVSFIRWLCHCLERCRTRFTEWCRVIWQWICNRLAGR
jgi:hypothetical protein